MFPSLAEHLASERTDPALAAVLLAVADAVPALAERLALGTLAGDPGRVVGRNESGDAQKALDLWAHDLMLDALAMAPVRSVLSEEAEEVVALDARGLFDVAIDPVDGSGSLGLGLPLGLLMAVWPAGQDGFARPGREAVAALYVSFGHSTDLGLAIGQGVTLATLDRKAREFRVTAPAAVMPARGDTIAFNASNERHWAPGLQAYVRELRAGVEGPRGRDANMRWLAAAVGELHRILRQGGAFLYPADARPGYGAGRLRLLYEAVPIALLIEAAGGAASDGQGPILHRTPQGLHEHVPLIFGARDEVALIHRHIA